MQSTIRSPRVFPKPYLTLRLNAPSDARLISSCYEKNCGRKEDLPDHINELYSPQQDLNASPFLITRTVSTNPTSPKKLRGTPIPVEKMALQSSLRTKVNKIDAPAMKNITDAGIKSGRLSATGLKPKRTDLQNGKLNLQTKPILTLPSARKSPQTVRKTPSSKSPDSRKSSQCPQSNNSSEVSRTLRPSNVHPTLPRPKSREENASRATPTSKQKLSPSAKRISGISAETKNCKNADKFSPSKRNSDVFSPISRTSISNHNTLEVGKVRKKSTDDSKVSLLHDRSGEILMTNEKILSLDKKADVFCIVCSWFTGQIEVLKSTIERLEAELRARILNNEHEMQICKEELKDATNQLASCSMEHRQSLEDERSIHRAAIEQLSRELKAERENEVRSSIQKHEAVLKELKQFYELQLSEERHMWAIKLSETREQFLKDLSYQETLHERKVSELKKEHSEQVDDITSKFNLLNASLSRKVENLTSDCEELRFQSARPSSPMSISNGEFNASVRISSEDNYSPLQVHEDSNINDSFFVTPTMSRSLTAGQKSTFPNLLTFSSPQTRSKRSQTCTAKSRTLHSGALSSPQPKLPTQNGNRQLVDEIESLNSVLELKNVELVDLRRKFMQQEQQCEEMKELREKLNQMNYQKENLEELLTMRSEADRQLQERCCELCQNLEFEVREKKSLMMQCEELKYKLFDSNRLLQEYVLLESKEKGDDTHLHLPRMTSSVHSSLRMRSPQVGGERPTSEFTQRERGCDEDAPAGSFISIGRRPRGLQHDRTKRRTLASNRELDKSM